MLTQERNQSWANGPRTYWVIGVILMAHGAVTGIGCQSDADAYTEPTPVTRHATNTPFASSMAGSAEVFKGSDQ